MFADRYPEDTRQTPSRHSDQWNDPQWRATWLKGYTDEEIDSMSPLERGLLIENYVYSNGYHYYGAIARYFIRGYEIASRAGMDVGKYQPMEIINMGRAREGALK